MQETTTFGDGSLLGGGGDMHLMVSEQSREHWDDQIGVELLQRVGLRPGNRLMDFGAGTGHYTLPAARVTTRTGMVYAVEKSRNCLNHILKNARDQGIVQIQPVLIDGGAAPAIPLQTELLDVILAYDVLHLLDNRRKIYREFHRLLKPDGLFSIHPKHTVNDYPLGGFAEMTLSDIRQEISGSGFRLTGYFRTYLCHDGNLEMGRIVNFRKQLTTGKSRFPSSQKTGDYS